ncbi:hypothetical protein Aperf_G00000046567 [Anoplocephala perfoliata]
MAGYRTTLMPDPNDIENGAEYDQEEQNEYDVIYDPNQNPDTLIVHEPQQDNEDEEIALEATEDEESVEDDVDHDDDIEQESDYDVPLPDQLSTDLVQHKATTMPHRAVDRYRTETVKVLTDVDVLGGNGNLSGAELAMELAQENEDEEDEGNTSQLLAEIHDCQGFLNVWAEVFHKAIDLLDSYLFVNAIVPMDYEMVAVACVALAYEFKAGENPEVIYAKFPPVGGFYTIGQIRNYAYEMKMRSGRWLCRCPTPLDYYALYEFALTEFEDELGLWVKTAFYYILELAMPFVEFCKITSCAKAALVLHLIRYILRKNCDCDQFYGMCEHHFMDVWPPRLVRLTQCTQSRYFLKGVRKYAETLLNIEHPRFGRDNIFESDFDEHEAEVDGEPPPFIKVVWTSDEEIALEATEDEEYEGDDGDNDDDDNYGDFGEDGNDDDIDDDEEEEDEDEDDDGQESDYDVPLPDQLSTDLVQHKATTMPHRAVDRYRTETVKVLTDVDVLGGNGNLSGAELAMELAQENEDEEDEGNTSQLLAEIHDCQGFLNVWAEVFHKAIDLLDSYLFVNAIVPMDYEMVAVACVALAYEFKAGGNPEVIYAKFPPVGGFYTIGQIRNYAYEMKMRSGRWLCRCPTPLDYYALYEIALTEFEDELGLWVKTAFYYILELTMPFVEFCKITSCAKAALVLYLIRYILRKKCDCDESGGVCEHQFMDVWPPRLVRLTQCTQSRYFLKGVRKYAETLVIIEHMSAPIHRNRTSPVGISAAFDKYVETVATDPKLTDLTMEDFGF